ncbi:uncharacterized protein MONBRDRAFT_36039 [Monosiga brevicollis MX1]|uniref:Uncharacterized protein n=1 Tax=Monosiga brevicollis TaxID=81824 RepID=A9URH8_MONBE|nr:uncharacterized protein MONBRDRAFT_36039 [Monosiga brevicollis MX1]EDQ91926.1 predicted protein [Monosiga brevicollis MX1]|eukprot:XP_001743212.1 hypothetical protein [Monosiga brevicollis MX1]
MAERANITSARVKRADLASRSMPNFRHTRAAFSSSDSPPSEPKQRRLQRAHHINEPPLRHASPDPAPLRRASLVPPQATTSTPTAATSVHARRGRLSAPTQSDAQAYTQSKPSASSPNIDRRSLLRRPSAPAMMPGKSNALEQASMAFLLHPDSHASRSRPSTSQSRAARAEARSLKARSMINMRSAPHSRTASRPHSPVDWENMAPYHRPRSSHRSPEQQSSHITSKQFEALSALQSQREQRFSKEQAFERQGWSELNRRAQEHMLVQRSMDDGLFSDRNFVSLPASPTRARSRSPSPYPWAQLGSSQANSRSASLAESDPSSPSPSNSPSPVRYQPTTSSSTTGPQPPSTNVRDAASGSSDTASRSRRRSRHAYVTSSPMTPELSPGIAALNRLQSPAMLSSTDARSTTSKSSSPSELLPRHRSSSLEDVSGHALSQEERRSRMTFKSVPASPNLARRGSKSLQPHPPNRASATPSDAGIDQCSPGTERPHQPEPPRRPRPSGSARATRVATSSRRRSLPTPPRTQLPTPTPLSALGRGSSQSIGDIDLGRHSPSGSSDHSRRPRFRSDPTTVQLDVLGESPLDARAEAPEPSVSPSDHVLVQPAERALQVCEGYRAARNLLKSQSQCSFTRASVLQDFNPEECFRTALEQKSGSTTRLGGETCADLIED